MGARPCMFDLCVRRGPHTIHLDSSGGEWVTIDGIVPTESLASDTTERIVIPLVEPAPESRTCCAPRCTHQALIRCTCGMSTCGCNPCVVGHIAAHATEYGVTASLARSWAAGIVSGRPGAGVGRT